MCPHDRIVREPEAARRRLGKLPCILGGRKEQVFCAVLLGKRLELEPWNLEPETWNL